MKFLAASFASLAWSACDNIGNNGSNSGFHVKTDWPAGDATGFEGLITVPLGGSTLRDWTIQVTFNTGVYDFELWEADAHMVTQDSKVWHFTSKWNSVESGQLQFNFLASHYSGQGNLSGSVISCGDGDKPNGGTDPTNPPPTDEPGETYPPLPDNQDCNGPNGRNVAHSQQSIVGGYNPSSGAYDYAEAMHKSILFFEAQRAGPMPQSNRVLWRGDSALKDGCDVGANLMKGWFDAGDHVKFNFPMAFSSTFLGWGLIDYKDGYVKAGEYENMLDSLKWAYEYFINCHPEKNVLHMQVGDGFADHGYWGRPEEMNMHRPTFTLNTNAPGSDLAGETAAALATCYIIFKDEDSGFADNCLAHARDLYDFAINYKGKYSDSSPQVGNFYNSWSGYQDELVWGAAWLYRATGDSYYLGEAQKYYSNHVGEMFSWDDKTAGNQVLLAQLTGDGGYTGDVLNYYSFLKNQAKRTPKGLIWLSQWGSNRYASNAAFLMMHGKKLDRMSPSDQTEYFNLGKSQIDYVLGNGGRSYVCGFGHNPPQQPHHRSSSCPAVPQGCNGGAPGANPWILYGALVGGPDEWDNYVDDRNDYIANEVACDYNAGFQSALAIIT